MIKNIISLPGVEEWCDHCKMHCKDIRPPFLIQSDNPNMKDMVLCSCCIDLALNEYKILPEEF